PESLDDAVGEVEPAAAEQHGELLAAVAGDDVAGAQHREPRGHHRLQDAVARLVALLVVEDLEVVEVEHGDAERLAVAPAAGDAALQLLVPGAPVGNA